MSSLTPTTPENIPDDILAAAEDALDMLLCNCREAGDVRSHSIRDIALAILAERERCALISESMFKGSLLSGVCACIASKIRTPTSARGSISNAEGAGGVSPPAPLASKSYSLQEPASQAARPDALPLAASVHQFESDGPKSLPGDAAASLTQQSNSQRQERPSAQECSSDHSGGQFGDAPKPAQIQETRA